MEIPVVIEVSARHIHLSDEDAKILFGKDYQFTWVKDLSQPGQFTCKEKVQIESEAGQILANVRVLGPNRGETEIELSATDFYGLGEFELKYHSGTEELTNRTTMVVKGPKGEISKPLAVVKRRHLHCDSESAKKYGLSQGEFVSVEVRGERSMTFHKVVVRVDDNFVLRCHVDVDEGNAAGIISGVKGRIIINGKEG